MPQQAKKTFRGKWIRVFFILYLRARRRYTRLSGKKKQGDPNMLPLLTILPQDNNCSDLWPIYSYVPGRHKLVHICRISSANHSNSLYASSSQTNLQFMRKNKNCCSQLRQQQLMWSNDLSVALRMNSKTNTLLPWSRSSYRIICRQLISVEREISK